MRAGPVLASGRISITKSCREDDWGEDDVPAIADNMRKGILMAAVDGPASDAAQLISPRRERRFGSAVGAILFRRAKHGQGPNLFGLIGRGGGGARFNYSDGIKEALKGRYGIRCWMPGLPIR
jgi:hypothetical protein